jgi:hypothetical protein
VFLLDDILVRPFLSVLGLLQAMALDELYDVDALHDELKENRLLFEIGDRDREEYERRKTEIETRIELAEQVRERLSTKVEIKR